MYNAKVVDVREPLKDAESLIFSDSQGPSQCIFRVTKFASTLGFHTVESQDNPVVYLNYADLDNLILALQEAKKNWVQS